MVSHKDAELSIILKFGGGVNSAASEDDVGQTECVEGYNFILDYRNKNLKPRNPIKKLGTAPNNQPVNGFANLVKANGDTTILVQAGTVVYNWSEALGFVSVGTVPSNSKLRGHLHHYWPLDDIVIITDLNLVGPVLQWNGSALSTMSHNLTGQFRSKYCWVDNERAHFANIISNSVAIPHMIVASELSDYTSLSVSDRPSSSLGAGDPFYLLSPDLRAVNGIIGFFDTIVSSTEKGSLFRIDGADSTDTAINKFYPRSFAVGDESMAFIGNDVIFGRIGRIEGVVSTQNYGDIALDDITVPIKPDLADLADWLIAYNPRTQKVYVHAAEDDAIWQYSKDVNPQEASPWVKLRTNASFGMNPTAMMTMIDPVDGLEYVYMGDTYGNLYKIEGEAGELDAGAYSIDTLWRSGVYRFSPDLIGDKFIGYINYRAGADTEIEIRLLFGGSYVTTDVINVQLNGDAGGTYFGEDAYFGGPYYFGVSFGGSFRREAIDGAGASEEIQIEIRHSGTANFEINEVGLKFDAKTNP